MNHKNAENFFVKLSIFMRNLLNQWHLKPKEIEGKNWNCRKVDHKKKVVCTSSFAKKRTWKTDMNLFTSNSFAAVTFRIRGNLWHKNMLSWIIHFCTVVGFSQGSRLQNTSTEVTSLLGSPHFVISFLTNLKISNENSSVGRIGWSQPALSNFSNAFNSGSVIRSFFLWS